MQFHPSIASVLQYFDYRHLPEPLKAESKRFAELAMHLAATLPSSPELTVALRKLLEAKDAAVRARKGGDPMAVSAELHSELQGTPA